MKKAGKILRDAGQYTTAQVADAQDVVGSWRGVHAYPLNSAQVSLRTRIASETAWTPFVAQRLKERRCGQGPWPPLLGVDRNSPEAQMNISLAPVRR